MTAEGPRPHRDRAHAALELGRFADAEQEARRAIGEAPQSEDGHGLLAQALLGQHKRHEGLKAAEEGLRVAPQSEWLHRLRSSALEQLDRHADALAAADEAVRLNPDSANGHRRRGSVLARMRNFDGARAAYERALQLAPEDPALRSEVGDLFLDANPRTAEGLYRQSLSIDPRSAHTLNNLGVALMKQKRVKDAALAFRAAVLIDPTLTVAKQNTQSSVNQLVYDGGVAFFLMLLAMGCSCTPLGPFAWLGSAVLYGLYFLVRSRRGKKNLEALASDDPQLAALYLKLSEDKAAGRL